MRDIFKPRSEPAASIYEAFQREATKRKGREFREWNDAEIRAVLREAALRAPEFGLRSPSIDEIRSAERSASGHIDYGAKWAYGVVDIMQRKDNP